MTRTQLHHAVAGRTDDSARTVRRLGFQVDRPGAAGPAAELRLVVDCPRCRLPVAYPGRAGDGSEALAECDQPDCDLYFGYQADQVYASGSP